MRQQPLNNNERGQVLILMVLGLAALLGAVALTLDIGMAYHERRGLQNAVDAAALAGAIELPSSASLAETKARAWAAKNGITDKDGLTVTISNTYIPNDTITVSVSRHVPYYFSALLGIKGGNVPATGRARVGSPAGMNRFVPLAVQQTTFAGLSPGAAATLKYDSQDATKGNSLALAFPGSSGANDFRHDIYNGSTQTLCVSGQEYPGCSSTTSTEPGGTIWFGIRAPRAILMLRSSSPIPAIPRTSRSTLPAILSRPTTLRRASA
ncbi:MAG: hypothetical protein E6J42_01585 [Chloroflexi bacterium]|nr:MAG: hypothetical protein E6J42_01585 [Chloroflexota bacterium]